jgi:hypothetical protein
MAALATALGFLTGLVTIVGGIVIIVIALQQHTKKLEMQHRERLAMIERGLVPPPPGANVQRALSQPASRSGRSAAPRHTSLGVAIVGVGLALMLIISVAGGSPDAGVGVGGAIAVLGAAFIVNGYLQRGASPPPPPLPPTASDPHDSVRRPEL